MVKKIVFISHITEEKELALKTKELIESSFLGMIEVFVSSDESDIPLGQKWLDSISYSLKNCAIEIILCSPKSINRPWINFEAGAGWVRDISVIPLCHSWMLPSKLPIPLSLWQAAKASDESSLKLLFPVLAQAIGSSVPSIDFWTFTEFVKDFEQRYTYWNELNTIMENLNNFNKELLPALKNGTRIKIGLTENHIIFFNNLMNFLTPNKLLELKRIGNCKVTPNWTFYDFNLIPLENISKIWTDKNSKFKDL